MSKKLAPSWLGKIGKAKWKELSAKLGSVADNERDTLALLCSSWETYLLAYEDVLKNGVAYRDTANGRCWNNPSVNTQTAMARVINSLSKQFGLSGAVRDASAEVGDDDGMGDLLGGEN